MTPDSAPPSPRAVETAAPPSAPTPFPATTESPAPSAGDVAAPQSTSRFSEDWAATLVGLALVILVLAGVIGKGLVP